MPKILIVDDDPQMFKLYKTMFTMEGFEAEIAEDGQEGADKAKAFQPDVILLDIMMKNVNGLEALKQLKADDRVKKIPVVVLSNVSDPSVMSDAKTFGAAQYIVKSDTEPTDMTALVRSVIAKVKAGADPNSVGSSIYVAGSQELKPPEPAPAPDTTTMPDALAMPDPLAAPNPANPGDDSDQPQD
jgi:DNA-binding response OmpR family regulator